MFSPTARTTPTRLPWWWMLLAMWLLMALWSPAFAADFDAGALRVPEGAPEALRVGEWQLVGMTEMLRSARGDGAVPRMLPLVVLPAQRSAMWLGLSGSRGAGTRLELRWTMSLGD